MTDGSAGAPAEPTPPPADPAGHRQGPQPTAAAPVPPYAAHLSGQPGAYGAAGPQYAAPQQQLYPGAPPTYVTPGAGRPIPPGSGGSQVLGIIALVLAIVGSLLAFVPFVGALFAWIFLLAAIVLAIISLVRRSEGRGLSIAALIVAGIGLVLAVLWAAGLALFGHWFTGWARDDDYDVPDEEEYSYSYPSLGAPNLGIEGSSRADALAFGSPITIVDENGGDEVWEITVNPPEVADATASQGADVPAVNGAYIAVPIELTNVGDEAIDLATDYEYAPYTWLITGDGGRAEPGYLSEYTVAYDLGEVDPGQTVVYYEVFDVAAEVASTGTLVVELDSGQQVFWGPGQ